MYKKSIMAVSIALALSACGGGSGGGKAPTIATGQFKDANTSGISYVSGSQSGVTNSDGSFTYEIGETVFFSVGGVKIGSTNGKIVVTPIDLIPNSNSSTPEVQNIVRLLIMLDEDGDPSNGITISAAIQNVAKSWSQVDFNATNLTVELASIVADVAEADTRIPILPNANTAQQHLEATLRCSYSGGYKGKYTGGDKGNFLALIDPFTGQMSGLSYSTLYSDETIITGTAPIGYGQNVNFKGGNTTNGSEFTGSFTTIDKIAGTWKNTSADIDGNFFGSRIGGAKNAMYRFIGRFEGDDSGAFTFDIDDSNAVTGVSYSIAYDELITGTGTLSNSTDLSLMSSNGTTVTATINLTTGTLTSGAWTNPENGGKSGTFTGSGCRLN